MILKITAVLGLALYLFLCVVAIANGADGLRNVLIVPLVIAILVGAGNLMQGFMGIPGRSPKFRKPEDDEKK